jgi:glycosyltransferase involved in cell wall biosynthesis
LWLDIAALVRQALPETQFLIVGDGPMRSAMERRAAQADLNGSVHFAGHLKDAMGAISDMDLLLLTSRAEGLPNVLVEAQFLGVPVVATAVGGAPETLDHGNTGWLLDSDDAKAGAQQIVRLLGDADWRRAASAGGPAFASSRFGMQRAIDQTLAAYGL